jgi:hypothetical protein
MNLGKLWGYLEPERNALPLYGRFTEGALKTADLIAAPVLARWPQIVCETR